MAAEHLLDFHFPLRHVLLSGTASGKEGTASDRLRDHYHAGYGFVMPDAIVIMGILSFFGLATLITALLNPLLSRIPAFCRSSRKLPAVSAYKGSPYGYLGFESFRLLELPRFSISGKIMMVLGFPLRWILFYRLFSADTLDFPVFSGYFTWQLILWAALLRQRPLSGMLYCGTLPRAAAFRLFCTPAASGEAEMPAAGVPGKNTLPVYMLHQPVLMAIFTLIDLIGVL